MPSRLSLLFLTASLCLPLAAADEPKEEHKCCFREGNSGAYVQAIGPLHDLKTALDARTGFGIGMQWTHEHRDWYANRTRLEFNVFPESAPLEPGSVKTYAKNVVLSFDHLFRLNQGRTRAYFVAGLGGARWSLSQESPSSSSTLCTTKLALTGGFGVQLHERVNLELRYFMGGIQKTFDANQVQASVGLMF